MRTQLATLGLLALCAIATAPPSRAAGLPDLKPDEWSVGPKPNDNGSSLGVEWKEQADERAYLEAVKASVVAKKRRGDLEKMNAPIPDDLKTLPVVPTAPPYEYAFAVSGTEAGEEFTEVARTTSVGAMKEDAADVFGTSAIDARGHFAAIDLTGLVDTKELADAAFTDEKPVADRTEAEKATLSKIVTLLGADTVKRARVHLANEQVSKSSELTDVASAGYFGDGGLRRILLDRDWRVRISVRAGDRDAPAGEPKRARPHGALFNTLRVNQVIVMIVLTGLVLGFIQVARRNPNMFLRRIGGLDAVEEALGRATEMGKPVLFVHGLKTMGDISTIAAVNILGEIAKKVARYDTKLLCVNNDPIVLAVSQETVKEGYLNAGRPDAYNQDDVFFVAAEQFSYVAAVDGIMVRQRPAANFYCGAFYAESLLLSETGAQTGAIQIAATDSYTQLPFFVTTCDYTLMGEELYAASAYLSRDPLLLGSLKGQDWAKAGIITLILSGTFLETMGALMRVAPTDLGHWSHWLTNLLKAY